MKTNILINIQEYTGAILGCLWIGHYIKPALIFAVGGFMFVSFLWINYWFKSFNEFKPKGL